MRSCQKILVHCSSRTLLCTFGKFTFWNWFWIDSIHVVTYFVWIPRRLAGGGRRPLTARSQHTCPAGRDGRGPKAPFLRVHRKLGFENSAQIFSKFYSPVIFFSPKLTIPATLLRARMFELHLFSSHIFPFKLFLKENSFFSTWVEE